MLADHTISALLRPDGHCSSCSGPSPRKQISAAVGLISQQSSSFAPNIRQVPGSSTVLPGTVPTPESAPDRARVGWFPNRSMIPSQAPEFHIGCCPSAVEQVDSSTRQSDSSRTVATTCQTATPIVLGLILSGDAPVNLDLVRFVVERGAEPVL